MTGGNGGVVQNVSQTVLMEKEKATLNLSVLTDALTEKFGIRPKENASAPAELTFFIQDVNPFPLALEGKLLMFPCAFVCAQEESFGVEADPNVSVTPGRVAPQDKDLVLITRDVHLLTAPEEGYCGEIIVSAFLENTGAIFKANASTNQNQQLAREGESYETETASALLENTGVTLNLNASLYRTAPATDTSVKVMNSVYVIMEVGTLQEADVSAPAELTLLAQAVSLAPEEKFGIPDTYGVNAPGGKPGVLRAILALASPAQTAGQKAEAHVLKQPPKSARREAQGRETNVSDPYHPNPLASSLITFMRSC